MGTGRGGELQQPRALIGRTTEQRKLQVTQQRDKQHEAAERRIEGRCLGGRPFQPGLPPICLCITGGGADACLPFNSTQQA